MAPVAEELDPVTLALMNAPEDDEPETEEERAAVEETREFLRAGGKLTTLDEFAEELGIELSREP